MSANMLHDNFMAFMNYAVYLFFFCHLFHQLYFRIYFNFITEHHTTGFQGSIISDSEIFAADFSGNGKACFCLPVRIHNYSTKFYIQCYRFCNSCNS